MTPDETKRLAEIRNQLWIRHPDEWPESTVRWLLDLLDNRDARIAELEAANQSLQWQLEDRVKLEHSQEAYLEAAKEKSVWVQKCAGMARRIAKLEAALREIANCKNDSRIEETPWIAEEALKP